jgi:uncharacterized membrane protein (UPF0127 family)
MKFGTIESNRGVTIAHHVRIASTFFRRLVGLLGHCDLPLDHGLLLQPCGSVHTLGMRFPIDALFLDGQGRILKIAHTLRPNCLALAPGGTQAVLELAAGRAGAFDLHAGDMLRLNVRGAS